MSDDKDEMRDQLVRMARAVVEMDPNGEGYGPSVEDVLAAAEAGNDLAVAVLAYMTPQMIVTQPVLADHVHTWTKVSENLQGITLTRQYECLVCNSYTTLVGPVGATSPFDVEEVHHDRAQDTSS